jgi:hypothetical protein
VNKTSTDDEWLVVLSEGPKQQRRMSELGDALDHHLILAVAMAIKFFAALDGAWHHRSPGEAVKRRTCNEFRQRSGISRPW